MGASFDNWAAVADSAYYAGIGAEALWLIVAIVLCIVAIVVGHIHESKANSE